MKLGRKIINKFAERFYAYHCPVCERKVKTFKPLPDYYHKQLSAHGYLYSLDAAETLNYRQYSCPYCNASDRDRLYALFIKDKASGSDNKSKFDIVEFAPFAPLGRLIKKFGIFNLRTADLFMDGVDDKIDITEMSAYADNSFDAFICSHVLEHVPDDRRALRELHRILKPGGWGILMVPILLALDEIDEDPAVTDEAERWRRFGQDDHIRMYSRKGFLDRVEAAGFKINQHGCSYFSRDVFRKCAIAERSILYVVEKY